MPDTKTKTPERKTLKVEELEEVVRTLPISVTDKRLLGEALAERFDLDARPFYDLPQDLVDVIGRPGVADPHVEHELFTKRRDETTTFVPSPTPSVP